MNRRSVWGRWLFLLVVALAVGSVRELIFGNGSPRTHTLDPLARQHDSPFLIADAMPRYPAGLVAPAGGEATVDIVINGQGVVTQARVAHTTLPEANAALVEAARQYRFEMPVSLRSGGASMALMFKIPPLSDRDATTQ